MASKKPRRRKSAAPRARYVFRALVAVDFDGVLHDFKLGWTGYVPTGAPLPGALEFIRSIEARGYEPVIFSARADSAYGVRCIAEWLKKHGFPVLRIHGKLNAIAFVDDRGVHCDPALGGPQDGFEWALTEIDRLADVRRDTPAIADEARVVRTYDSGLPGLDEWSDEALGSFEDDALAACEARWAEEELFSDAHHGAYPWDR